MIWIVIWFTIVEIRPLDYHRPYEKKEWHYVVMSSSEMAKQVSAGIKDSSILPVKIESYCKEAQNHD